MMKKLSLGTAIFVLLSTSAYGGLSDLHGFAELDYGVKLSDDTTKNNNYNLLEQRAQIKYLHYFEGQSYLADKGGVFNFKGDFLVDEYYGGRTDFDIREVNILFSPTQLMDIKAGRQVLTWGTGDYLFINDLFPKDYKSFFIGRSDEYLKKPSDAIKMSFFPSIFNVDFIVSRFEQNSVAQGERLSYYDPFRSMIAGRGNLRELVEPAFRMSNNEYALRIFKNINSNELAVYYFSGFDKNPSSFKDEAAKQLFFRKIDVYGTSIRGPFAQGIGNVEIGYYHSREDSDGTDRLIPNSSIKTLLGYERDLGNDLKVGFQYLYEQSLDYGNYTASLLPGDLMFDETRYLLTQRVTKQYKNQTVTASLFNFYSPSDQDGYVRPSVSYDISDQWRVTLGANLPWGTDDYTEFGQMKKNKNIYTRVRYSF